MKTKKKSSDKMLPPVGIEPWPLITSDSKSSFQAKWACAT